MIYQLQNDNTIYLENNLWPCLLSLSNTHYKQMRSFFKDFAKYLKTNPNSKIVSDYLLEGISPHLWSKERKLLKKHQEVLNWISGDKQLVESTISDYHTAEFYDFCEHASRYIVWMDKILSKTDSMSKEERTQYLNTAADNLKQIRELQIKEVGLDLSFPSNACFLMKYQLDSMMNLSNTQLPLPREENFFTDGEVNDIYDDVCNVVVVNVKKPGFIIHTKKEGKTTEGQKIEQDRNVSIIIYDLAFDKANLPTLDDIRIQDCTLDSYKTLIHEQTKRQLTIARRKAIRDLKRLQRDLGELYVLEESLGLLPLLQGQDNLSFFYHFSEEEKIAGRILDANNQVLEEKGKVYQKTPKNDFH